MPNGTSLIYLENLAVGLKRIHGEIKKPYSGQNPPKPTVRAFTILIFTLFPAMDMYTSAQIKLMLV